MNDQLKPAAHPMCSRFFIIVLKAQSFFILQVSSIMELERILKLFSFSSVNRLTKKRNPLSGSFANFIGWQSGENGETKGGIFLRKAKVYTASVILLFSLLSLSPDIQAETGASGEGISGFLIHPVIVTILLSIAMLGLLLELFTPGLTFPGIAGLGALGLFFISHWMEGLVGFDSIILLIIGFGFFFAEIFLPGGIAAFLGLAAILLSVLLTGSDLRTTGIAILIALMVASAGMVILVKFFGKRLQLFSKVILTDSTDTKSGYVSTVNRFELIGQTAVTMNALRPSGTIKLSDERIDAVSEGRYIEAGKDVKIIKVEGSRIVVRELEKEEEE